MIISRNEKRASWFKLFLHQKPLLDAASDREAGRALKAAMQYFSTGEVTELSGLAGAVFASMKPYIDESFEEFQRSAEAGRKAAQARWNRADAPDAPPIAPLNTPIAPYTEADAEAEADADAEAEAEEETEADAYTDGRKKAGAKRSRRFAPPCTDEVKAYCEEKGYCMDAERFVDYYTANGWRVGRNPMRDWKAAVRNWHKGKGSMNGRPEIQFTGSIGTVL